ncbi:MAG: 3-oxoadipyl-CoA thiolase [Gammaproteobacteria bacterium]|jgi:acetyl-CoA C-acetyltransferase|nr:3-oxoadipyl-CoA thiolase [Gammaproteobacteria bacterium]MBT3859691.1 3-oxoadipyl-CoA thiolase [Gammaproteobacteria bacterium]MBT3987212.1 3-oxoadipyl-CoA thiolase [Gammaproteobacteria bacterium]MBT4581596.1 3-oxoadipyl-CoA thiolase [Gammaproteobacteria bacterium]MBT4659434.1 3-oxoadipyl-CoA thiolase [Gammaproteobacteria bacterium]
MSDKILSDAYIYDGGRTAFGRHAGALSPIRPDDLLGHTIKAVVERNPFAADAYEDVIMGNTNGAGEDCRNVARFSLLRAGMPTSVAGLTVNRLCGSGLAATLDAARAVKSGEGELFLAGGVESMSRAPIVMSKAQSAFDRGQTIADSTLGARFTNPAYASAYGNDTMPQTADNIAADIGISREQSDIFAAASQSKYEAARVDGFFDEEIISVEVPQGRKKPSIMVSADEHPRPTSNMDALSGLRPLFEGGVVTAGNASGINDGAAALIVGSKAIGEKFGASPRARIVAGAVAGVEPRVMGLGPVFAIRKALDRAGLTLADMDIIEINEAFATQVLGCLSMLDVDLNDSRVNPNGGAIAIGHPLGASGARIAITTTRQLERMNGRYAVISLCIGIGQGVAAVIERV